MQTSRPAASDFGPGHSPYAPDFALDIAEALCRQLHIKYCVFVGQADGSALAALVAARLKGCAFCAVPKSWLLGRHMDQKGWVLQSCVL